MLALYSLLINLYENGIRVVAAFGHKRAQKLVTGRKLGIRNSVKRSVWFHCASLGEFEQAMPLIELVKTNFPEKRLVVSFYSPSGYEAIKHRNIIDDIVYLPADTERKAKCFIEAINPEIAIFVKYEFWFNHLRVLKQKGIDVYFISVLLRPNHFLFSWFSSEFRRILSEVKCILTQNQDTERLLRTVEIGCVQSAGDTRFDRVSSIAREAIRIDLVNQFKKGSKLVVAGSSWEGEEQFLSDYAKETGYSSCKILIAPHDVSEVHLQEIEALFEGNIIRYSQYTGEDIGVLLVDNIGILSRAYLHADIAFVGGGFTNKLHNILEPAAHGVPVLFGSNHGKFPEASGLVNASGGMLFLHIRILNPSWISWLVIQV